jgi:hypothetical protein
LARWLAEEAAFRGRGMSRSRYVGLEQAETRGVRARTLAERRAVLEEQLAVALFDADAEMVSRLRAELVRLDAMERDR